MYYKCTSCGGWAVPQGLKTALKPAFEPIVWAQKPMVGNYAENVARYGTGALNIEASRIGTGERPTYARHADARPGEFDTGATYDGGTTAAGRYPSNLILTDPIFDGGWDGVVGGGESGPMPGRYARNVMPADGSWSEIYGNGKGIPTVGEVGGYGDSGGYSRFFLISKAPRAERVLSDGRRSPHPTQKPEALIRHLVRLITPDGGLVLDPFLGSGTLGVVCEDLGVRWVGIEREESYADWANDRINDHVNRGLGLDVPAPTPKRVGKVPAEPHRPKYRRPSENWSGGWAGTGSVLHGSPDDKHGEVT